jgi:hypothetical protein
VRWETEGQWGREVACFCWRCPKPGVALLSLVSHTPVFIAAVSTFAIPPGAPCDCPPALALFLSRDDAHAFFCPAVLLVHLFTQERGQPFLAALRCGACVLLGDPALG